MLPAVVLVLAVVFASARYMRGSQVQDREELASLVSEVQQYREREVREMQIDQHMCDMSLQQAVARAGRCVSTRSAAGEQKRGISSYREKVMIIAACRSNHRVALVQFSSIPYPNSCRFYIYDDSA